MKRTVLLVLAILLASTAAADAFGSRSGPQPNVTDVEIYEVTGLSSSDKETGGELVDSGLNTTLEVNLSEQQEYRFSFKIENAGDSSWSIENADELFHSGLNDAWTVDRIWYNTTQDYDGGTFSSGKVTWDTSQGGTLSQDGTMYAKYLATIDPGAASYSQRFEVNDTSNESGSFDVHELDTTELGYLDVNMTAPANETIIRKDRKFLMEADVTCEGGACGEVVASPRYNESGAADTVVPNSGSPFNTSDRLRQCDPDLGSGESCSVDFYVDASGPDPSYHRLDVNASSSYDISSNDSEDSSVSIQNVVLFDLNWTTVDFGSPSPGDTDVPAGGNSGSEYNITVDEDSVEIDDLWIRATDLSSNKLDYTIPAENLSYALKNDVSNEKPLTNTYQKLKSSVAPGSVVTTFYWLDVPTGIYNGGYSGSIYFKGNESS